MDPRNHFFSFNGKLILLFKSPAVTYVLVLLEAFWTAVEVQADIHFREIPSLFRRVVVCVSHAHYSF